MDVDQQQATATPKPQIKPKRNTVQAERGSLHQNSDADSDIESRTSTEQSSSMHTENNLDEIEIVLKPHPHKEHHWNLKRYIKITSNAFGKMK